MPLPSSQHQTPKQRFFAEVYADRMTPNNNDQQPLSDRLQIEASAKRRKRSPYKTAPASVEPVTAATVREILTTLKPKKSAGLDGIKHEILKALPPPAISILAAIFTELLKQGLFPEEWRIACITVIPKPGKDLSHPSHYRPISLLSNLGKLYEAVILFRLAKETDRLKVLPHVQFGFRPGHSTTQQLLRLMEFLTMQANEQKVVLIAALDVNAAFDKVDHDTPATQNK